jgi:predicted ATPase
LSSLVGREREIQEVGLLLREHRLLTLTGAGGAGKTRLALAAAHEAATGYEDGAWWVELAPVSESDLVPRAVARALSVRERPGRTPTEDLADDLRGLEIQLVLDNCEHLIEGCASLSEALLGACPGLTILATSREALGVEGEALFLVPPLSLPDPRRRWAPGLRLATRLRHSR